MLASYNNNSVCRSIGTRVRRIVNLNEPLAVVAHDINHCSIGVNVSNISTYLHYPVYCLIDSFPKEKVRTSKKFSLEFWHHATVTVYPKKYAHGFCFAVLCCGYSLTDFPISIRLTSLALWQSNDCPSASKATLVNMDKYLMWIHYERLHNHNKAKHNKTVCIFLGIYCMNNNTSMIMDGCVTDAVLRNLCRLLGLVEKQWVCTSLGMSEVGPRCIFTDREKTLALASLRGLK